MRLATSLVILSMVWLPGCRSSRPEPSPGDVQVLLRRGVSSADSGDDRAAIADYDEVLRLQPENAEAAYLRGAARDRLGDRAGAVADYDTALRLNAREVADAQVAALQMIPGYSALADAQKLKDDAAAAPARIIYGGGSTFGYLTAYDRKSVMHYKYVDPGINGNYDDTGLSDLDRLSVHILYPEDARVAEFAGTTVVPSTGRVVLRSAWGVRGGDLPFTATNFEWKVANVTRSTGPVLDVQLLEGTYELRFAYSDFLGRAYSYAGTIRVLNPAAYAAQAAAVSVGLSSLF